MKLITNILNFFTSFKEPRPPRDWIVILCLIFAVLIALVGWAIFLFLGIRSGAIIGSAEGQEVATPTVTRGELQEALDHYQKKEANFDARNYPTPSLSDPSL